MNSRQSNKCTEKDCLISLSCDEPYLKYDISISMALKQDSFSIQPFSHTVAILWRRHKFGAFHLKRVSLQNTQISDHVSLGPKRRKIFWHFPRLNNKSCVSSGPPFPNRISGLSIWKRVRYPTAWKVSIAYVFPDPDQAPICRLFFCLSEWHPALVERTF